MNRPAQHRDDRFCTCVHICRSTDLEADALPRRQGDALGELFAAQDGHYLLLELTMMETTQDGAYLLDISLHIFESVADEQPLFKAYIEQEIEKEMVRSPDGLQSFSRYESVLSTEAQTPSDPSNAVATTATINLLEVMAAAAIAKMHDPKISGADKLTNQEGVNAYYQNEDAHAVTLGAHNKNDAVEVRDPPTSACMRDRACTHMRACSLSLPPLSLPGIWCTQ
eukprot:4769417-Pleurochrysis_carterae.AAC.1